MGKLEKRFVAYFWNTHLKSLYLEIKYFYIYKKQLQELKKKVSAKDPNNHHAG